MNMCFIFCHFTGPWHLKIHHLASSHGHHLFLLQMNWTGWKERGWARSLSIFSGVAACSNFSSNMLKALPACLHSSCVCFVLHYSYSFLANGGPSGLPRSASCCWLIFPLAGKAVLLSWFVCTALLLPGSLLRHGNFLILNRDLSISLWILKSQPNIKSNQTLALHRARLLH